MLYEDAGKMVISEKLDRWRFGVRVWREMASFDNPQGRRAVTVYLGKRFVTVFLPWTGGRR